MSASKEARFWFSPARGRLTWREPSELIYPLTEPNDWRPLVFIDPEDREQMRRIAECAANGDAAEWRVDMWQRYFRGLANPTPPKPEEPTGLGAVVEDEDGSLLIRNAPTGSRPWVTMHGATFDWADIDVARILSEGVQP